MPVEIPEPFRSALANDDAGSVCDADATTGHELFARGLARGRVGRDADARSDFESARPELEDPCVIQLGYLDLRSGLHAAEVSSATREIAERSPNGPLKAQALHVTGLAEAKLRNTTAALDALVAARDECRACGRRDLLAQVEDTLGMVHGAAGRLDLARREGCARYLRVIQEAMTRLQLVESAVEEQGRLMAQDGADAEPGPVVTDGYVLFESLGKGGGSARSSAHSTRSARRSSPSGFRSSSRPWRSLPRSSAGSTCNGVLPKPTSVYCRSTCTSRAGFSSCSSS